MNATVEDLRSTIIPKSDQLNSEQLMFGAMDITVTGVDAKNGEQPVTIHYEGEAGRPFKPCLTMRKVLVHAWGENGTKWAGRSMRLYCDPAVRFGKDEVGGVRISHLTDIPKDIRVSLTATKGKKALYEIKRMDAPADGLGETVRLISECANVEDLKATFGTAYKAAGKDSGARGRLKVAYDLRMAALNLAAFIDRVDNAESAEAAEAVLVEARGVLPAEIMPELQAAFEHAWTEPPTTEDQGEPK